MLQVTPVWGTRLGRIAATLAVASGIAVAGMVPVAVVLVVVAQVPGWWWVGNRVLVLLAPTAIDLLSRLRFVRPGPPAAPSAPCGEVHLGASLAAWPAAHEHGTRLLKAFSEAVEATGRDTPLAVDIYPRDGLRDFYTGHGFRVINPHTGLMRRTWPENR